MVPQLGRGKKIRIARLRVGMLGGRVVGIVFQYHR